MIVALLLLCQPAWADRGVSLSNSTHAVLPNGLTLEVKDGGLFVVREGARAPVPLPEDRPGYLAPVESLDEVSAADNKAWVTVKFADACDRKDEITFNLNVLWARTENALGMGAYHRKDYANASKLFARARQIDPGFDVAATNESSALALAGKTVGALDVLAPLIAKAPAQTYLKCLTDPDLAPLLKEPRLANLKAGARGTAQLKLDEIMAGGQEFSAGKFVAYEPARGLVAAVFQRMVEYGGEHELLYHWESRLFISDAKTGTVLAKLPLVEVEDTPARQDYGKPLPVPKSRVPQIQKRLDLANLALSDLGLQAVDQRKAVPSPGGQRTGELAFPGTKLTLTSNYSDHAELRNGETVVAQPKFVEYIFWASYLPGPGLVVFQWGQASSEGCPKNIYNGIAVLRP